jgi:uncharacterized protein YoxC
MDIPTADKKLQGKLKLLKLLSEDTKAILEQRDLETIERHLNTIQKKLSEVQDLKVSIQELKFENDVSETEIRDWSAEVEKNIEPFKEVGNELKEVVKKMKQEEAEKEDKIKQEQRINLEKEIEKIKFEEKINYEKQLEDMHSKTLINSAQGASKVKLPKLVITKFNGTFTDWMRFWNQYEAEIDKSDISPVSKFSYLKELLIPSVRAIIDALPLTYEGYERGKQILKSKYGKPSEIVNAYVQNIMSLPHIRDANVNQIHDFYAKLASSVQALEALGKLKTVAGYARLTLDKLEGIRADLVRMDDEWQDWDFTQLLEQLRKWTERNPVQSDQDTDRNNKNSKRKFFGAQGHEVKPRACAYCEATNHKSSECTKVTQVADRKKILVTKALCFNCTGSKHKASACRSQNSCQKCKRRHHTSICDSNTKLPEAGKNGGEPIYVATGTGKVVYPVVVVRINGIKCRALLDTGAGSSYASSVLLEKINSQPVRRENKRIDMMMESCNKRIEVHKVTICSLDNDFKINTEVTKVDRDKLLTLDNPKYQDKINLFAHLQGVSMDDDDTKAELPVHVILGASEYAQIKTETKPRVGHPGEPVAERTRFGWTMMSPGKEVDLGNVLLAQTSSVDYENLCRLDVLGLKDTPPGSQENVYEEFQEQLTRSPEGWYQTGLPWKASHPPLRSNEVGSLKRLNSLTKRLEKSPDLLEKYDKIIKEQLEDGVVERVTGSAQEKEFYLPHKPVVRESAESTKVRIVFDASARENESSPSLNECLETGPPLQNLLWNVLVRNRFYPVAIAGDLMKAFLQVRIVESERDVMRFHWYKDLQTRVVEVLRFTRALFGLAPSPFLLGGVVKQHLESCRARYPEETEEILKSLYVDDLIGGGTTTAEAQHLKDTATTVFQEAKFQLHKWHSNEASLETENEPSRDEQSYAKTQLGVKAGETKLLGLTWNKVDDKIAVQFQKCEIPTPTKREVLSNVAKIYDPLGVVSPTSLTGKLLYREICDRKIPWDKELPPDLVAKWSGWQDELPDKVEIPRSLVSNREVISDIKLHAFGDASGKGVSAVVFAVIEQPSGVSQGQVCAKSRLAKEQLTIPRQELVSAHMACNLVHNVKQALEGFPVSEVYGWLDSTVALHWLKGGGEYKQFVRNRVLKILEKAYIQWRYVNTKENPADLGSRGGNVTEAAQLWLSGPEWLSKQERWPDDVTTMSTDQSRAELKPVKEILVVAVDEKSPFDELLEKHELWKTIRIMSWMKRFIHNTKRCNKEKKISGPITTAETETILKFWILKAQNEGKNGKSFEEERARLNLQPNEEGVLECRGRIQGEFPIYLPDTSLFSQKLVADAHKKTLHGGVGYTMTKVRNTYWIPRLRRLVKKVIHKCNGCKRFQVKPLPDPPVGDLPEDRTKGEVPFQTIGVDYAGPIKYRQKKSERKAYILLYSCSLTRAVYLDLVPNLSTEEFIRSFKRLVARRGRPKKIYSDNGKTFVAASKWVKSVVEDEKLQNWLAQNEIKWQFNLSRAPWWGGQFERMVGLVKQAFYKTVGNGNLKWNELEEIIIDIETALNSRPLCYVEDDVQLPLLTPNAMLFGQPNLIPERDPAAIEERDLRKRAKYLRKCKDALWSRWSTEYVKSLRERHNLKHNSKGMKLEPGDVVLIRGEERNRGHWRIGIVEKLIKGRDKVVRGARLRTGKSYLERPVQLLFPLELSCDMPPPKDKESTPMNANAPVFRPKRKAAQAARELLANIAAEEQEDYEWTF